MTERISAISDFLLQLDALKSVNRRTYINAGERVENSAEHSWHLAMACWAFAELLQDDYDVAKLIKLALLHDLGEIGAGDTFLYSNKRNSAHIEERKSVKEIALHPGNPIDSIVELWDEQEAGESKEARLLKVIDRLLPFLHNITSEGRAWRGNGIHIPVLPDSLESQQVTFLSKVLTLTLLNKVTNFLNTVPEYRI